MLGGRVTGIFMVSVLAGASAALLVPQLARAAPDSDRAGRCAGLADVQLPGLTIDKVELAPAQEAIGDEKNGEPRAMLPEHCLLRGTIDRRTGVGNRPYGIGFELRLPASWNGRFLFQGGAGLDGVIQPAVGKVAHSVQPPALARGFAVVSTDAGHSGSPIDASFAVDQQARIDYGYNAIDKVTSAAKALIRSHYGAVPRHSYFVGCSNGGRQALTAAQRLPLQFDGIVAGDPTIRFSRVALDEVWNLHVLARIAPKDERGRPIYARAFSDDDLKLVRSAVLKRCDARDGLADGMINDWRGCDFDPAVLVCKGAKNATCLGASQVEALRDLHRGPRAASGKPLYGHFNYDTGIASPAWRGMRLGTSQTGEPNAADSYLGLGAYKYLHLTPPEPGLTPQSPLNLDQAVDRIRHTAALTDADNPYLTSFVGHGKMIVYNGLSDQGLASSVLAQWHEEMLAASGPAARDAVRLFFVPGMLHCGGGEATDQFELVDAIVDWVEKGRTPNRIAATSKQLPARTRPLCPHPTIARYRGGDANSADSFECRE
jgi:feruloyl esterase